MLWEIVGTPHKLLGSCHCLPENFEFQDWVTRSRDGIKIFVFERDHRNSSESGLGIDQTGEHLKISGTPELYQRAKSILVSIGCNESIESLLPWRAALYLQECICLQLGLKHKNGLERRFRTLADIMGLSVEFLESPNRTFEIIDLACRPHKGGIALFEEIVKDSETGALKLQLQNSIDAWISNEFEAYIITQMDHIKRPLYFYNAVNTHRSIEWVTPAKRLLSETTPTLFIVGALHTIGDESFNRQLEIAGFRLKFIV